MENQKKINYVNIIGGILFILMALSQLGGMTRFFSNGFKFLPFLSSLVTAGGCAIIAVSMFAKRRDKLLCIGVGLLALSALYIFFMGFKWHYYSAYTYSSVKKMGIYSFNPLFILPGIVLLAGYVGSALLTFNKLTDKLPQFDEYAKKLWFVPAACIAGTVVVALIVWILSFISGNSWGGYRRYMNFGNIFSGAAMLCVAMYIVFPDGVAVKHMEKNADGTYSASNIPNEQEGYCGLAKHVLLLLFTFGIWQLIWIYKTTAYLNRVEDEPPRDPVTKLLLCMFVPFYIIYWVYKSAQRIDKLARAKGMVSDLSTLCLILEIFVSIIPPILMQDKINAIISTNGTATNTAAPNNQNSSVYNESATVNIGVPEELKKYKELLDAGIITQEEFDNKKKQLLDL